MFEQALEKPQRSLTKQFRRFLAHVSSNRCSLYSLSCGIRCPRGRQNSQDMPTALYYSIRLVVSEWVVFKHQPDTVISRTQLSQQSCPWLGLGWSKGWDWSEILFSVFGLGHGSQKMADLRKKCKLCICNFVLSIGRQIHSACSLVYYSYGRPIVFRCMGLVGYGFGWLLGPRVHLAVVGLGQLFCG